MTIHSRPQSAAASAQPVAQPMTQHAVAQGQPAVVAQQQGCCCSVPSGASQSVKVSRWSSIAVIVIHALALVFYGYYVWYQWIASLMGIIMGSILLCIFSRCCYITATVLFSVGAIFDFIMMLIWFYVDLAAYAILPLLGAVSLIIGAIATGMAACNWHESGAPDATVVQNGPIQIVQHLPAPSINATAVQPNYSNPSAPKRPPPAYPGAV